MPTLSIRFTSDWRVGTGGGEPGGIDERARRDSSGLPIIPAKTLIGMWRDGCERVAAALDSGDAGAWNDWVDILFGSQPGVSPDSHPPLPAAVAIRTAVLEPELHDALSREPRVGAALFGVRPGVKLDPDSHHAVAKHLRFAEVVRAGVVLNADFSICDSTWEPEQRLTAWTLLALGAQECRSIGANRRRGLGRCVLTLSELDDATRRQLTADDPPKAAAVPAKSEAATDAAQATVDRDEWQTLCVRTLCVDPLLSPSVTAGFEVRGLPYLPGARLLPKLVAAARSSGVDIEPLIASGGLICEPLVPEAQGVAAKPLPRCLVAPKAFEGEGELTNRFRVATENQRTPAGAWLIDGDDTRMLRPETEIRLHNTVQDEVQRPTEEVGGLYSYQVLPAGSQLSGAIHLRLDAATATAIAEQLAGDTDLGTSRKDEYGRVRLECSVEARHTTSPAAGAEAVIYFRTDTVLLDDGLAPVTTLSGVVNALGGVLDTELNVKNHSITFRRIDSWQTRWVRPRQTLIAVAAGSVVAVSRLDGVAFDNAALGRLEFDGLGERCAEGFGRVEVNPAMLTSDTLTVHSVHGTGAAPAGDPSEFDDVLLHELRAVTFTREVDQAVAAAPAELGIAFAQLPASQRGHLRRVLRTAAASPDPTAVVSEFRDDLAKAKVRSSRWPQGAVQGLAKLTEPGEVWQLLNLDVGKGWRAQIASGHEHWALSRLFSHLAAGGARRSGNPVPEEN